MTWKIFHSKYIFGKSGNSIVINPEFKRNINGTTWDYDESTQQNSTAYYTFTNVMPFTRRNVKILTFF